MDAERLRDVLNRGMGQAARVIGDDYDVFRTRHATDPMASGNRIMRLPIILDNGATNYQRPRGFERVLRATLDGIALLPGDYLRGPRGVLFVAALPPSERALCVLTNAVVDVLRPSGAVVAGLNSYGGVTEGTLERVLSGWPVQIAQLPGRGRGALPADGGASMSSVLFPVTPAQLLASDLLQDASGRRYVVTSCDSSEMGWHLSVAGTEV